jgi:hypothetical protein
LVKARMRKEKLTGLAIIYIHKDLNIYSENNLKNIIKRFSKEKQQKLDFVF